MGPKKLEGFGVVGAGAFNIEKRQLLSGSKSINFDFGMDGRRGMEKVKREVLVA